MEMPERMGTFGCGRRNGLSMFKPFWRRRSAVLPLFLGSAGVISSTAVGEVSGIFFVQRMT
jgi:hypothetical protein